VKSVTTTNVTGLVQTKIKPSQKVRVSSKVEKRLRNIAMSGSDCMVERGIIAQAAMVDLSVSTEN
jgi:hypothetical protein